MKVGQVKFNPYKKKGGELAEGGCTKIHPFKRGSTKRFTQSQGGLQQVSGLQFSHFGASPSP